MQASAEVIKDLANQNSLLVQRAEMARLRLVRLAMGGSVGLALLSIATIYLWTTH
jgi:hypothetical protein